MLSVQDPFKKTANFFDLSKTWMGKSIAIAMAAKSLEKTGPLGMILPLGYFAFRYLDILLFGVKTDLEQRKRIEVNNLNDINQQIQTIKVIQSLFRKIIYTSTALGGFYAFYTNPKGLIANQTVNYFGDYMLNAIYTRLLPHIRRQMLLNEIFALLHAIKLELGKKVYLSFMKENKVGKDHFLPTEKEQENLAKLKKAQEHYEVVRSKTLKELENKLIRYFWFSSSMEEGETITVQVTHGKLSELKNQLSLIGFDAEICTKHEIHQKWEGGKGYSVFWEKMEQNNVNSKNIL